MDVFTSEEYDGFFPTTSSLPVTNVDRTAYQVVGITGSQLLIMEQSGHVRSMKPEGMDSSLLADIEERNEAGDVFQVSFFRKVAIFA